MSSEICPECNQNSYKYGYWCKSYAQLNANDHWEAIQWIPYDRFKDIKQIGKGGFGTIYYARWIDGDIEKWNFENQQWKRFGYGGFEVALKKFDNIVNLNDVLNEMEIHLKTYSGNGLTTIRFYGITQDPETHSFMMVLDYVTDGNLREYLKNNFDNINWKQKLSNLRELSEKYSFHPGNILSSDFKDDLEISDFGLIGVLPYIAPEVLSGDEEYTKAADVFSFGIIAYEIITGFPPYPDIPHDEDLAIKICNGLRPKIPFHTPKLITRMIMGCWDARVTHRPTFEELLDELHKYYLDYKDYLEKGKNKDSEIVIQIKKAEEFSENQESTNTTTIATPLNYQTHPQAIYTSRLLNYSKLPKPKNEENFERELEELTKSFFHIITNDDIDEF
ncbi:hypothetical protein Glove_198g106 [Diversispora epigaea]|uniref:Protein kinase domain-containing protein n=1 Tax=Diversispora epigaea TaxID=1348612 RepID=A0A397IQ60_9GLOM|nr:hypothetical protein Glove_198g106 [Diversispora epigaea]